MSPFGELFEACPFEAVVPVSTFISEEEGDSLGAPERSVVAWTGKENSESKDSSYSAQANGAQVVRQIDKSGHVPESRVL